ncbi:hypothetical protein PVAND_003307 [Polypedilum vanderplanki]|uniref:Uncharacterized protein n=1 Tax=Polypedilum vanderplanki TaxID=319348 RepID=A0A9J6BTN7_POLVA|nr:hypothetical protein PVAND_003307 [Polypedilum vanderplanki]
MFDNGKVLVIFYVDILDAIERNEIKIDKLDMEIDNLFTKVHQKAYSINFKYKNIQISEIKRKRQFNEVDFLSFIGGLLGVFAGFSFLSFIEIFYWLALKTFIHIRKKKMIQPLTVSQVMSMKNSKKFMTKCQEYFKNTSIHGLAYFANTKFIERKLVKLSVCYYQINYMVDKTDFKVIKYYDETLFETAQYDWFKQQYVKWNEKNKVRFSRNLMYDKGIVYTFNMMDSRQLLNLENVHDDFICKRNISMSNQLSMTNFLNYPIKTDSKDHSIFRFRFKEIKIDNSKTELCRRRSIIIHKQETFLRVTIDYDEIKIDHSMNIEITPKIIKTDMSLRKIDPFVRDCYFENEKKLKYFKIYTEKYCRLECMIPILERKQEQLENNEKFSFKQNCSCLPTCDSIEYHVDVYPSDDGADDNETFVINVRMNTDNMILFRRYQQFSFSDAISYVGGLLGLFAGISVLSIVEIFYFITLRLLNDILRLLKRQFA